MQNQTPPENDQDAFNRVWTHFIIEKHPKSTQPDGTRCLYRSPDGTNGCAIGCMLPDRNAKRADKMKEGAIESILRNSRVIKRWFMNVDTILLCDLQDSHDNSFVDLKPILENIAHEKGLTIPQQ